MTAPRPPVQFAPATFPLSAFTNQAFTSSTEGWTVLAPAFCSDTASTALAFSNLGHSFVKSVFEAYISAQFTSPLIAKANPMMSPLPSTTGERCFR